VVKRKKEASVINRATEPGPRFHKWKKQLLYFDKFLYVAVVLSLGLFRIDFLMICVYVFLFPYLLFTQRKDAIYHLVVSSFVALVWMLIANDQYGYNREVILFFGLNTFPLFAWASGLFAAYIIYSHWEYKVLSKGWISKLSLFTFIYVILLVVFETAAYHLFGIHNLSTASYSGIPFLNSFHAPFWMQVSYFLLGPIYFLICEITGLENPHLSRKKN